MQMNDEAQPLPTSDQLEVAAMAKAFHDGPLGANDHEFRSDSEQGKWCIEVAQFFLDAATTLLGEKEAEVEQWRAWSEGLTPAELSNGMNNLKKAKETAEARVKVLESEAAERQEMELTGSADEIARMIESHDLFECPEGSTYVAAAQAIAQAIVDRFGTVRAALSDGGA